PTTSAMPTRSATGSRSSIVVARSALSPRPRSASMNSRPRWLVTRNCRTFPRNSAARYSHHPVLDLSPRLRRRRHLSSQGHSKGTSMTLRFGLLGAGRIGKVHAKAVAANPAAKLVAVADAVEKAAADLASAYDAQVC